MSIRALIVDDEPLARTGVAQLLEPVDDIDIVGEAADGTEAVEKIEAEDPDLVFLDVQMPEMSGLEVVGEVGVDQMPVTIFVTAYDEYAVDAFDAHALDYLLKPIDEDRFEEALDRARRRLHEVDADALSERLQGLLQQYNADDDEANGGTIERSISWSPTTCSGSSRRATTWPSTTARMRISSEKP